MSAVSRGLRTCLRLSVVGALLVAGSALPTAGAHAGEAQYQNFDAIGPVVSADAATGTVVINMTSGSEASQSAQASDGTLTVHTQPQTKYYLLDTPTSSYNNSTFGNVMVPTKNIEVAGRFARGSSTYELVTNYSWSPPPASIAPPAVNPKPSNNKDQVPTQSFSAVGTVSQNGVALYAGLLWSDKWGFVINTSAGNTGTDPRMAQIAAAHHDQLPITIDATTKYYDGAGAASTRDAVVHTGAVLFVGGHYMWNGFDWLLVATYVFPPTNAPSSGSMSFEVTANRSKDGQIDSNGNFDGVQYDGQISAGDGQLNPGSISLSNVQWEYDTQRAKWVFTATWQATQLSSHAGVGGTMSGTWSSLPSASDLKADVVVDPAFDTGYYVGVVGGGTFSGHGAAETDSSKPPVAAILGQFVLQVRHS